MFKRIYILITFCSFFIPTSLLAQRIGEQFRHFLGFELDNDSFAVVQKRLGAATIVEKGDAGDYEASMNYFIPQCKTFVSFKSNDIGGANHTIEGAVLRKCSFIEATHRKFMVCSDIKCDELAIGELKLGLSKTEVKHLYGKRVSWKGEKFSITIEGEEPVKTIEGTTEQFHLYIGIDGIFKNGVIEELNIWVSRTS